MARWLISFAVALLLALALHGMALWGISQELQAVASVVAPHADPMFTRQITQAAVAQGRVPAMSVPQQALAAKKMAVAAPKSVVKNTPKIPLQESPPPLEPQPPALQPTPTVVLGTPTDAALAAAPSSTPLAMPTSAQVDADSAAGAAVQASSANPSLDANASATLGTNAALALQGQWPADTRLSYQVGGYFLGDLHGDAQVQWTRPPALDAQPDDRYQVRINISLGLLGKGQMTSQGRVRSTGLQPQVYEEQLPARGPRSVKLDAQDVLLTDGRRIRRPAQDQSVVQDTASQFVELGHRFSTGRAVLKEGETISVWLARPGGLNEWIYDIGPAETIYLPILGAVQAHHLKPRPVAAARGSITAEMWIAPSLQHLPVRIKITLNKEAHLDLLVRKIEQR